MNDLVVQGLVAAVVTGVLQGYYRVIDSRKQAEAGASTQRLGSNLGPRVQEHGERLARIEGRLGLPPLQEAGTVAVQQGIDAGQAPPVGPAAG